MSMLPVEMVDLSKRFECLLIAGESFQGWVNNLLIRMQNDMVRGGDSHLSKDFFS